MKLEVATFTRQHASSYSHRRHQQCQNLSQQYGRLMNIDVDASHPPLSQLYRHPHSAWKGPGQVQQAPGSQCAQARFKNSQRAWPPPKIIEPVRKNASHQLQRQARKSELRIAHPGRSICIATHEKPSDKACQRISKYIISALTHGSQANSAMHYHQALLDLPAQPEL